MRFVVLFFGVVAILLTAAAGAVYFESQAIQDMAKEASVDIPEIVFKFPTGHSSRDVGLYLWIAAAYGFFGVILGFFRCGKQGGVLLLLPVLGAALMNPISLGFTALQAMTGLASFMVGPLPINSPDDDNDADED